MAGSTRDQKGKQLFDGREMGSPHFSSIIITPITLVEPQSIEELVTEHQIAGSAAVQEVNSHHSVQLFNANRQELYLFCTEV